MQYNSELFYRNDLTTKCADTQVIYISDPNNRDYGYYYLYATSDATLGCKGYSSWRSKDLNKWELMGTAFSPDSGSWALKNLWAPEVKYDEGSGKYLMYFSACDTTAGASYMIGLATADNPWGPFTQYIPAGGTLKSPFLDPQQLLNNVKATDPDHTMTTMSTIDVSPWQDPTTGKKYLYFARSGRIYGMEMTDWYTPKYSTLKQLTAQKRYTLTGVTGEATYETGSCNEGPCMVEHDGKYYLTFSINGYTGGSYSVVQAVATSPLGDFRKLTAAEGGVILSDDYGSWDNISGPGHHCLVQVGDELFIVYHEHIDRTGTGQRAVAVDPVKWTQNSNGDTVLYVNGPTWSLQPRLNFVSKYHNIASEATVTATNIIRTDTEKLRSLSALNDGLLSLYSGNNFVPECNANAGTTTITLKFADFRKISAIMIYNSKNYNEAFQNIDRIEFVYKRPDFDGTISTGYIDNVGFDWDHYLNQVTLNTMRPGGSAVAEFNEIEVNEIRITINDTNAVSLSEIAVLGK